MFFLKKISIINNFRKYQNLTYKSCVEAVSKSKYKNNVYYLNKGAFKKSKAISFDYAILEKSLTEGGPENYAQVPAYTREVDGNTKFEIKPYSVTFIANTDNTAGQITVPKKKVNFNNPFQNQLSFLGELIPEQVTIFDVNGVPVLSSTSKIIDTSQLSPGVYFLVLEIEGAQVVYKSIKL